MLSRAAVRRFGVLFALTAAACGSEQDETAATGEVAVDLFLDDAGVRITRVYPAAEFPVAKFTNHQSSLHYELIDVTGYRVVAGQVPDWRMAYTERMPDGSMLYDPQRLSFGSGSIRLPAVAGTLVVRERASGVELGRVDFRPITTTRGGIGSVRQGLADDEDILGEPVLFDGDLGTDAAVDLLFLGDGYLEDQMEVFEADARNMFNAFIALHYYQFFGARFNGWSQNVRSSEEGIDDPDNGIEKDTAFDFGFGEGDLRRCVFFKTGEGMDLAKKLGAEAGADVVVVIANTTEYGGCASNGVFSVTKDAAGAEVVAHELGHALFGLADEYDYGGTPPCAHDSDAPNVTNHGTRDGVPWADLVTASEFPTPPGSGGVGAFEGAGYCPEGMFRPEDNCLMRSLGTPFCAVCAREVNRFFENFGSPQGPQNDCPPEWYDDGICDLCLGDDPDCAAEVCDYDGSCDVDDGEDCGDCEADCGGCGHTGNGCSWWDEVVCHALGNCADRCPQSSDSCGDGVCNGIEDDGNCGEDCGCAAVGQCTTVAPYGCWCDSSCADFGDCCSDIEVCGF